MRMKLSLLISALVCMVLFISSCASSLPSYGFLYEDGRLVVKSTDKELKESHAALDEVNEESVPSSMNGGVLFEGELIQQFPDDPFGQTVWLLHPAKIIYGNVEGNITLTSPKLDNGGVLFLPGEKYRVFTVKLDGRFYVWRAVVLKLRDQWGRSR